MAIGDHVRKYQAEKEAKAAAEQAEALTAAEVPMPPAMAPVPGAAPTMADMLAMIKALAQELRAAPVTSDAQETAQKQVELIERLITKTHPENIDHPGIGVYSYPDGDLAHPKPELQCKMFWVGYELRTDTLTPQEVELLNRLKPGEFRVTKADGVGIPFRVSAKHSDKLDAQGRPTLEELSVWFPCKGDARQNHLSMTSYLQQALGDKLPTLEEAMAELTRLKAELASAQVGLGA